MLSLLRTLATIAWGLWFGGMIALLIFVGRLFVTSRETGIAGAPVLFRAFASYQLIVGAIAVLLALLLAFLSRSKLALIAAVFLGIALVTAIPIRSITRSMDELRLAGQSHSTEFQSMHQRSRSMYISSAVCLLLAGLVLPLTPSRRVDPDLADRRTPLERTAH